MAFMDHLSDEKPQYYPGFSLVVPVRDEQDSVFELVSRIAGVLRDFGNRSEVILIDDGSEDSTLAALTDAVNERGRGEAFRVITIPCSIGQAKAISLGISLSTHQFVIRMDGDLQDSPEDLPKFLNKITRGHDLVVGVREIRSHSRIERFSSAFFNAAAILVLDSPFHASVGSFVAFRKDLLEGVPFSRQTNRWMVLIALLRGAQNPAEIFVSHSRRKHGKSKYPKLPKILSASLGATWFFFSARLRYRQGRVGRSTLRQIRYEEVLLVPSGNSEAFPEVYLPSPSE